MTTSTSSRSSASRIRGESASECAGFELSTIIARRRPGSSVRISSAIELPGVSPVMIRAPLTGVALSLRKSPPREAMPVWMFIVPSRPKLPVSRKSSFSR